MATDERTNRQTDKHRVKPRRRLNKVGTLTADVTFGTHYSELCAEKWLAVWLSGNALASINVVALRQTRLVSKWVTVCGRVNHIGM